MIGVGATVVLVICGIIYIKYCRNNKPTTYDVNKRNSGSEEGNSPVMVDTVLSGTSAEPIQDLSEKADEVNPVNSCADVTASNVSPNIEFHAEEVVYNCSKNDESANGNSIKLPANDIYAAVVEKNKRK
uniref:uncharacterized protein LOC113475633 isoform X2 n=1 Tax=Ciona intestinalis TaxID=7719 RepID=UPI000EF4FD66|nr:uncharacterized protein LOC113475633 isoform X2 [Ciona intestinalis]|eukprot:XP_026695830.1 uncharacterized protein LOC113475633 isoform X2 [Ciona intestinalis]